ncbi:MAG: ABC-F family ATP-binding cassette domain-containing protein [Bacteroidales bacterium]|jgi:ATP-binding cassette subfamily F protein uup|nr:ABC-F family ATP-binding cassette domain-containing protein [Bacteroidales bacterium]
MAISYLIAENLTKSWGDKPLFENLKITINEGQKIALIAQNGTGKTSLLDILCGLDIPDSGEIRRKENLRIAYLQQEPSFEKGLTINEVLFHADNRFIELIKQYQNALKQYEKELNTDSQKQLDIAIRAMDHAEAWDYELKVKEILEKFELTNYDQKVETLSGGQHKKLAMASILIDDADLLVLDEPTNHLDIEMIEWLESYISKQKMSLLMVTHDRYFLDAVCTEIIEIDQQTSFIYRGNYSYFVQKKAEREAAEAAEIEKAKNRYRTELDWMRRQPKARTTKSKARIDSFYNLENIAKKRLEKKQIDFKVKMSRQGRKILEIKALSKSYGSLNLIENFDYIFKQGESIGIVGDNGSGKTTFLDLLTQKIQPDSGQVIAGETTRFGYFTQSGIQLQDDMRVLEIVKEIADQVEMGNSIISASQFLFHFGFSYNLQHSFFSSLSGGEKRKLHLVLTLLKNPNFLILDEPTNDLDLFTLGRLEEFLLEFKGCMLIVSHDRYFLDRLSDHLFVFNGNGKIKDFVGNYSDYKEMQNFENAEEKKAEKAIRKVNAPVKTISEKSRKISFKEQKEYEKLEIAITQLEQEKENLIEQMNSGTLSTDEMHKVSMRFEGLSKELDETEMRWLELSELFG